MTDARLADTYIRKGCSFPVAPIDTWRQFLSLNDTDTIAGETWSFLGFNSIITFWYSFEERGAA